MWQILYLLWYPASPVVQIVMHLVWFAVTNEISCEELKALMGKSKDLTLVDVRTKGEVDQGHISGSVNIPGKLLLHVKMMFYLHHFNFEIASCHSLSRLYSCSWYSTGSSKIWSRIIQGQIRSKQTIAGCPRLGILLPDGKARWNSHGPGS